VFGSIRVSSQWSYSALVSDGVTVNERARFELREVLVRPAFRDTGPPSKLIPTQLPISVIQQHPVEAFFFESALPSRLFEQHSI